MKAETIIAYFGVGFMVATVLRLFIHAIIESIRNRNLGKN